LDLEYPMPTSDTLLSTWMVVIGSGQRRNNLARGTQLARHTTQFALKILISK
jgi:hypothetical protein